MDVGGAADDPGVEEGGADSEVKGRAIDSEVDGIASCSEEGESVGSKEMVVVLEGSPVVGAADS